ncbi:MAG: hypothetical protein R3F19_18525 [Verrucomicrobiales bacterium]
MVAREDVKDSLINYLRTTQNEASEAPEIPRFSPIEIPVLPASFRLPTTRRNRCRARMASICLSLNLPPANTSMAKSLMIGHWAIGFQT